jgi:23S rRNA (cytosine1962-C5)-methyltransferase
MEVDQKFFEHESGRHWRCARNILPGATSFRVVNAESDFLSGLIVDKYEDVLVLQITSLGMDRRKD